ncbi:enoyl-ACP reductase FabI [Marinobacterium rhizophilum]|uniref:Enoyl-[acyl-carrier-protein] reductase [NADH] n=1 Tax=Marinobacterium rhizophilum TaxID=420402 RepID=A0ABY5HKV6_9GAMM|nr:enoyl-ACP reductase FabI [Marinobacterium rhizophilum]UTW12584.1 enoyl-ACP reductase FabI [Marinobacterium rhizophilum]
MGLAIDLNGKRGIVLGLANAQSIAFGCAQALREAGAQLCISYQNDKARPHVAPLAQELGASIFQACDVSHPEELEQLFDAAHKRWGSIDFVVHSIAWSPLDELHGRLLDSSPQGFARAMDISCHSFIRAARLAEALMPAGGTLLSMSYYGAEKVVDHYNMMGPIKAALESSVRYLAAELGGMNIRVHALSPGPMPTRAASGIAQFDSLMESTIARAPLHRLGTPQDVGAMAAFLVSDLAANLTGSTHYVDAGDHIML